MLSNWNTVAQSNAVVMWDHILRGLIRETLPRRNFPPQPRIALPLPDADRRVTIRLQRPDPEQLTEPVDIGFVRRDEYGVVISDAWQRGIYRLSAFRAGVNTTSQPAWNVAVAVNGPAEESHLQTMSGQQRELLMSLSGVSVSAGKQQPASGMQTNGSRPLWRWLLLVVLILLLVELGMLIYPWLRLVGLAAARQPASEN
jgi:hypothetical protein